MLLTGLCATCASLQLSRVHDLPIAVTSGTLPLASYRTLRSQFAGMSFATSSM